MTRLIKAAALLGVLSAGCAPISSTPDDVAASAPSAPTPAAAPLTFAGLPVEGTARQAAQLRFTDCTPEWDTQLVCTAPGMKPDVYGVAATEAAVVLQAQDQNGEASKLEGKALGDLTFRRIRFTFAGLKYDQACVDSPTKNPARSHSPDACALPGTIVALRNALEADGWSNSGPYTRSERLARQDLPVIVRFEHQTDGTYHAEVTRATPEEIADVIARHRARAQKPPAEALADQMRSGA